MRYPVTSDMYSMTPPTIAPSRLAANPTVESPTSRKRCVNTRLARKIGVNAISTADAKRGTKESESSDSGGTAHATASAASSPA
jgi:hypothetical protein